MVGGFRVQRRPMERQHKNWRTRRELLVAASVGEAGAASTTACSLRVPAAGNKQQRAQRKATRRRTVTADQNHPSKSPFPLAGFVRYFVRSARYRARCVALGRAVSTPSPPPPATTKCVCRCDTYVGRCEEFLPPALRPLGQRTRQFPTWQISGRSVTPSRNARCQ
jgi:hypothetical protein